MGDVERVVVVNVAVGVFVEVFEDVIFERVGVFHDVGVEIEPPEPMQLALRHWSAE